MHTQINVRRENPTWSKLCQCLGLLLFSLILAACSQGSDSPQGVISDDKLSAPFPKAITALLVDNSNLMVEVVINGDTDNPLQVENLDVDTTAGTFSGNVPGLPTGTYTLLLVYSIIDPGQGTVEVIRTSEITVDVVANEETPADFSSAGMTHTDTDGDGISNLDELDAGTDIGIANYTVGGQIEGLTGSGFVLQNDGSDDLTISEDGIFSFSPAMIDGSDYTVGVLTQPNNPNQVCTVNNGSGTLSGAAVSNITVTCSTTAYTIGGTVSGYVGSGLVLQNNDGDDLPVSADGAFSFNSAVADGSEYVVSVRTHPGSPGQICTVNNGSGTVSGAAVSNVAVICSTTSYTVGGTVSGYAGSGLVLQNNNSDDLPVSVNGTFSFSNAVADGSNYTVTVLTQPNNPNQICTVSNGSDTVSGAAVSSVAVTCSTTAYTVGGTVFGYTGSGLVLQNNDGDDLPINTNGTFTFTTPLTDTSTYAVTVFTQPDSPNQTCTVNNDKGIVSGSTVTNITVACETTSYTIGGTIIGLVGNGLVLQNNGGDDLLISSNGDFTFTAALTDGNDYAVTVQTQPGSPNQTCMVGNDKGTVSSTTIIDVTVTCVTASYTIGGTVTGLIGGELVLQNNGGDDLVINADGDFTFVTALADGSAYAVTVLTSPAEPTQRCTVENSEGVLEGGDANVTVSCQLLLFISADDGVVGRELFATDGTTANTFLVKDINTNTNANLHNLVAVGGVTYFVVMDVTRGDELWKTNGTTVGTVMVKNIWPGSGGGNLDKLTAVDGTLYFNANDGTNGWELWKSDGTAAGTVMVKDIWSGLSGSFPNHLTAVGRTLYFNANDGTNGRELWKSDGTATGTVMVKDIQSGSSVPDNLTAVGGTLYFGADDGANGRELWRSDGTIAGTVMVKDIRSGLSGSFPDHLMAVGSTLYFDADDGANGRELWRSDGSVAGTVMVKDIRPGSSGSLPDRLTAVGGMLYFRAKDVVNGWELWRSDGTATGTVMVKDIWSGSNSASPRDLMAVGNMLYFIADDGTNGGELWKSDGTEAGTVMVKDIWSGSFGSFPDNLTAVGSTLYFNASDGINGTELWKSDGTDVGTVLVDDINLGEGSSSPKDFSALGGVVYFSAYDGTNGRELWRSDGTANGTWLLADIGKVGGDSIPGQVITTGGISYFTADDGTSGNRMLWRSDGTTVGTVPVKNINIDSNLIVIGNTFYFSANDDIKGKELWKSDGSTAGTVMVKDIRPGSLSASPRNFTTVDNTLYFIADDGVTGWELWKSDGTAAGTVQVKDINFGVNSSNSSHLMAMDSTLYFRADDGTNGSELWKSDGTAAGTVMVKDIRSGSFGSFPNGLTAVGSTLYFSANDGVNGGKLWKSDGTAAGTVMVGSSGFSPFGLTAVGGTLYFTVAGNGGEELWKSDSTVAGTVRVVGAGASESFPRFPYFNLMAVGDTLYFSAYHITYGRELWKSDDTDPGTVLLVKDINSGLSGADPDNFRAVGNMLYFSADDGVNGRELWKSDGTDAGTVMVKDMNPNFEAGSDPVPLNMN